MSAHQRAISKTRLRIRILLVIESVFCSAVVYIFTVSTPCEKTLTAAVLASVFLVLMALFIERILWRQVLGPATWHSMSLIHLTQNTGHELATAVAIVKSKVQLLERQSPTTIRGADFQTLNDAAERASSIVDDLRFFLRSDALECKRGLSLVAVDEVVASCVKRFQRQLSSRALQVELDLRSCCMVGDPELIGRLIGNLLKNCVDHVRAGSRIGITLLRIEKKIVLIVEDDGDGIPETARGNIFDRAFSVPGMGNFVSTNQGLGLFIAKSIVEAHQGTISLEGDNSRGCRFRIEFPCTPVVHPFSGLLTKL